MSPSSGFIDPYAVCSTRELGDEAHQLLLPLVYQSEVLQAYLLTLPVRPLWDAVLTVPTGFVTDFMSIPRVLPIAYALIGGTARRAGVLHDFLYQTHLVPREIADALLPEAMAACGQAGWRCQLAWLGVRVGGRRAYASGPTRKQILADHASVDPLGGP